MNPLIKYSTKPQLSVEPLSISVGKTSALPEASKTAVYDALQIATGVNVSTTFTVVAQVPTLPSESSTKSVTD